MKAKNNLFISVIFLISVLSFSACHSDESKNEKEEQKANMPTVMVGEAQVKNFPHTISLAGAATANQDVKVYAMSKGFVKMWKYDIGDMVKRGDILAELGNPELLEEQEKAKAELDGVTSIYNRLESVYKKTPELVPLEQVDEAKAKYESALAALNALTTQISYLTVRAPFDGVITDRYIDVGTVVQDGLSSPNAAALFKIQDISIIRVNINIPEVNASYVTKSTGVNIIFPDIPNNVFEGNVSRISYGLSEESKTMLAQVDLVNKEGKIHPGMFANVIFKLSATDSMPSIANQGILNEEQQTFVYKVMPLDSTHATLDWMTGVKCIVKRVNVQLGIRTADYSELKYADLKKGEKIIISGNSKCSDGTIVIAKENKSSGK